MTRAERYSLLAAVTCLLAWPVGAGTPAAIPTYFDADTANEIDDFYAVYRAMIAPELCVLGVSSIGFSSSRDFGSTTRQSQQFNEEILLLLGARTVAHPLGALRAMPDRFTPVDSAAARDIIAKAKSIDGPQKLRVYATGALTNIASALLLEPSIVGKISVFIIGPSLRSGKIAFEDFNSKGDTAAAMMIMESNVHLNLMPSAAVISPEYMDYLADSTKPFPTTARPVFKWNLAVAERRLQGRGGIKSYLLGRWLMHAPLNKFLLGGESPALQRLLRIGRFTDTEWVMWDVALVQASLRPDTAQSMEIPIGGRSVHVWTELDNKAMEEDFWRASDAFASDETPGGQSHKPCSR